MNNFGVVELATAKTTNAPGWAYVPDTAPSLAAAASLQPGNRKRAARNQGGASTAALYADADARQNAKLRREIEALDRDNYHRDAGIPIPASARKDNKGIKKHTPNVRKILQSQKTFANHLDDFHALPPQERLAPTSTAASAPTTTQTDRNARSSRASVGAGKDKEPAQKNKKKAGPSSRSASVSKPHPAVKQEEDTDVTMTDAPETEQQQEQDNSNSNRSTILAPFSRPGYPPTHARDGEPLLSSRVPPLSTDAELRALLSAPPLTYAEARGQWADEDGKPYPARAFCEVCGYWGRVRCLKCGVRVCALDCLETHREECVTRYGL